MVDKLEKEDCCGCGVCKNICPSCAITMEEDREGFWYPKIDPNKCVGCNICLETCPSVNKREKKGEKTQAYACYAIDNAIRRKSTSGGVVAIIARYFIEELKGVVYGVVFDGNYNVVYKGIENIELLEQFQGSKYVQANTGDVYKDVKSKLDQNCMVLFTGMPCQIAALRNYLRRDYDNLFLIDIVCFGIGSPGIWNQYLNTFHIVSEINEIVFKDKIEGWKNWKFKIVERGEEKYYGRRENLYMNSYLQRINIRPSCFSCRFKGKYRNSDFSVGDCWGLGESDKEMNDNKGLSALLIHTRKGRDLFKKINYKFKYKEYNPELLMKGNWALEHSAEMSNIRSDFFEEYQRKDFKELFTKYFGS